MNKPLHKKQAFQSHTLFDDLEAQSFRFLPSELPRVFGSGDTALITNPLFQVPFNDQDLRLSFGSVSYVPTEDGDFAEIAGDVDAGSFVLLLSENDQLPLAQLESMTGEAASGLEGQGAASLSTDSADFYSALADYGSDEVDLDAQVSPSILDWLTGGGGGGGPGPEPDNSGPGNPPGPGAPNHGSGGGGAGGGNPPFGGGGGGGGFGGGGATGSWGGPGSAGNSKPGSKDAGEAPSLWQSIKNWFKKAADALGDTFGRATDAVKHAADVVYREVADNYHAVKEGVQDVWNSATGAAEQVTRNIAEVFTESFERQAELETLKAQGEQELAREGAEVIGKGYKAAKADVRESAVEYAVQATKAAYDVVIDYGLRKNPAGQIAAKVLHVGLDTTWEGSKAAGRDASWGEVAATAGILVGISVGAAMLTTAATPLAIVAAVGVGEFVLGSLAVNAVGWAFSGKTPFDPLVFDLDSDGIEVISVDISNVQFDVDADGYLERTTWVDSDDGFLVLDRNTNGSIDDITELFSEYSGGKTGFLSLIKYDVNEDGVIDGDDAVFDDLRIWRDLDGDGITDIGELTTLASHDITEISLDFSADIEANSTALELFKSNVTVDGGADLTLVELSFDADQMGFVASSGTGTNPDYVDEQGRGYILLDGPTGHTLVADETVAQIKGAEGNDHLTASSIGTHLYGGDGDDVLTGGDGNDWLQGDTGDDAIAGGGGNDKIVIDADDNLSSIDGGSGIDTLVVDSSSGVSLDMGALHVEVAVGGSGADTISTSGSDAIFIYGLDGNDELSGGVGNDAFAGQGGDDTIDGGSGIDAAIYYGSTSEYSIVTVGSVTTVTDLSVTGGSDGVDTLTNVERLQFSDQIIHLDGTNEAPLAVGDDEDIALGQIYVDLYQSMLTKNDRDSDADQLSVIAIGDVSHGQAELHQDGSVRFISFDDDATVGGFTYVASDGHGGESFAQAKIYMERASTFDPLSYYQWHLSETRVVDVWDEYKGAGIVIGICDTPIEFTHPDIAPNYDTGIDWDYHQNDGDPSPFPFFDGNHGTFVGGLIGAPLDGEGIVGVAPEATIAGYSGMVDFILDWRDVGIGPDPEVDIANNSWNLTKSFAPTIGFFTPTSYAVDGMENLSTLGRGGLGTSIVFASGNENADGASTDYDPLASSRFAIAVGATHFQGTIAGFSNPAASLLVSAPGTGIVSSDETGSTGYSDGESGGADYFMGAGTSASAPIVSGIIALMLEANPELGYRDVQEILAYSAYFVDAESASWQFNGASNWNGGGLHTSRAYGFGYVDAHSAVRLAETWTLQSVTADSALSGSALKEIAVSENSDPALAISDNATITDTISITQGVQIDHVTVDVDITHAHIGDLIISLVSPDGTESVLAFRPNKDPNDSGDTGSAATALRYTFTSTQFWGETGIGDWTLKVTDARTGATGTLNEWELTLYGDDPSDDSLYVYTDDYGSFTKPTDYGRWYLQDDTGTDTINAAAVNGNMVISLIGGEAGVIAGQVFGIAPDTVIENVFTGDGNDTIIGNDAANDIRSGRGDDHIHGSAGADHIDGGAGSDTVNYSESNAAVSVDLDSGTASGGFAAGDVLSGVESLAGSAFNDVLTGTDAGNALFGGDGDDELNGLDGTDLLMGGEGEDDIDAGDGDDVIAGGGGDDLLSGGAGKDIAMFAGLASSYAITDHTTYYTVSGADGVDTLTGIELLQFDDQTVDIAGVNHAPVAVVDSFSIEEGDVLTLLLSDLLANDTDADSDPLSVLSVGNLAHGSVMLSSDGVISFTHEAGFTGTASFDYTIFDDTGATSTQTVSIVVGAFSGDVIYGSDVGDLLEGGSGADKLIGGWGHDVLVGDGGNDIFDGGRQDDRLLGEAGDDTYIIRPSFGIDWISEDGGNDALEFGLGITPADVTVLHWINYYDENDQVVYGEDREGAALHHDLYLYMNGMDDAIIVRGFFDNDVSSANVVEEVRFDDGTVWDVADIKTLALQGTALTDYLYGYSSNDVLRGGEADDVLYGFAGDDTYVYAAGDGDDFIYNDYFSEAGDTDTILIEDSVDPNDVSFSLDDRDLIIDIGGATPGSITVKQFMGQGLVEEVVLENDSTITAEEILDGFLAGTSGVDNLTGSSAKEIYYGGAGNDTLSGRGGGDIYIFGLGDGEDTICDDGPGINVDTLIFLSDIELGDIILTRFGTGLQNLRMEVAGTSDKIEITDQFQKLGWSEIESFEFIDQIVSADDIRRLILDQDSTSGNDTIIGFSRADVIDGGAGNDTMAGLDGNDTYLFGVGDGDDIVDDGGVISTDTISFKSGIAAADIQLLRTGSNFDNLLVSIAGETDTITILDQFHHLGWDRIERFLFTDATVWDIEDIKSETLSRSITSGNDTVIGYASSADELDGGAGDDYLEGRSGADTYYFGLGYGDDTIYDNGNESDAVVDRIILGAGILTGDVELGRDANDLVLEIDGEPDTLLVKNFFTQSGRIEVIEFADSTEWDVADVNSVLGLSGAGTIYGTSGNNTITGTSSSELIDGRAGDDTINGMGGSDQYVYQAGSGNDTIGETTGPSDTDVILLGSEMPADIRLSTSLSDLDDLFLDILATGERLTVDEHFASTDKGIELIRFFDGSTWNRATIQANAWVRGTSSNETITGTGNNETFDMGGGNDYQNGAGGSDTYIYKTGSGNDTIDENGSGTYTDTVQFTGLDLADVEISRQLDGSHYHALIKISATGEILTVDDQFYGSDIYRVEQFVFDDTTLNVSQLQAAAWYRGTFSGETITGTADSERYDMGGGNDTISAGNGNDYIIGGAGADSITGGNGTDTVSYATAASGLTADFTTPANNTGDASGDTFATVENLTGSNYSDTLRGNSSSNGIEGGAGNDILTGNGGADTFVFHVGGFGADTITDFGAGAGMDDVIQIDDDIVDNYVDLLAAASTVGADTLIDFGGAGSVLLTGVSIASLNSNDFMYV